MATLPNRLRRARRRFLSLITLPVPARHDRSDLSLQKARIADRDGEIVVIPSLAPPPWFG